MNLLSRVRQQFNALASPKAISHRPDLAGREHLYRQGANTIVQQMDKFADYARVYECYGWAQKAIAKIAENLAGLPVRVVDAKDKALETHPLTALLLHVNDEQTSIDLWTSYTVNMMLGGEGPFELVADTRGRPVEIWSRRPDRVSVVPDAGRLAYPTATGYIVEPDEAPGETLNIDAAYMIFDKFYNPLNPWRGLPPIHAVREGITIDLYAQRWSKLFLRDNARPDFAIVAPQGITQSEKDDYEARFLMRHQGIDRAHLPVILEDGVTDIKVFSFPPKDIEWLQQREYSRDEVGAIFGVPDEIMGYGKDTYENFQTALEVFWTLTMMPFIRRRDTMLTHHFTRHNMGLQPGQRFATDVSGVGVLQQDLTPKVDLAKKFFDMGVPFNTLDKTLALGVGPVPGGEIGYLPGSLKTVEQIAEPPQPPPTAFPPASSARADDAGMGDEPDKDEPPQQRTIYLLPDGAKDGARRALKKLVQAYQDRHLRLLRSADAPPQPVPDCDDLRRWLGDNTAATVRALEHIISSMAGDHDTVNAAYTQLKEDANLTRLLEVTATPTFFTRARVSLPNGAITPSVYKRLLLQLDPNDDEAELAIRMVLERRTTRNLSAVFHDMLETLYPDGYGEFQNPEVEAQRVRRLFEEEQRLYDELSRALQDGTDLGVSVAVTQLENIGYGFDWTLANVSAREWALQHTGTLVRGLSETTQRGVRQSVARWIDNGEPLEALTHDLQTYFSRARAERIAATEVTRAYQRGSEDAWRESGVVAEMEWQTVLDEIVAKCPICAPMQGLRAALGQSWQHPTRGAITIPGHVGCRCFSRPVVKEPGEQ